jgi:hypothetical protein
VQDSYCAGVERIQSSGRGSAIDPSRSGLLIYSRDRLSGPREESTLNLIRKVTRLRGGEISTTPRVAWVHRDWRVDKWHLAPRELVRVRVEELGPKDVRPRGSEKGERPGVVHLKDRWRRSEKSRTIKQALAKARASILRRKEERVAAERNCGV